MRVMLEHMATCLAEGGGIELRGLGSFLVHFRRARAARNPKTGTPVFLSPEFVPYFKPGKVLRERVDRLPPGTDGVRTAGRSGPRDGAHTERPT